MADRFKIPRGTSDISPTEIPYWQGLENKARQLFATYYYKEIRTPIFEETALFARSMGKSSDVVQKQMLNLAAQNKDDGDAIVLSGLSLRPENTASVVRSYIENRLDKVENLSKLFYCGAQFRGERPQKGRLRQFHQIGVEVIGVDSNLPFIDAEVISLSVNYLKSLGLNKFKLKINTLGSQEDKASFSKTLREKIKPQLSDYCQECQNRFDRNIFRILDCKNESCKKLVAQLELSYDHLSENSQLHFAQVQKALDALDIAYEVDPFLVRGLDYYTHTVFELSDASLGSQDALGAGGRYNNLVKQLGGPEVDAVGFALGVERILLALDEDVKDVPTIAPLEVFIVTLDDESYKKGFEILNTLRQNGVSSDINHKISSMKSQMRLANKTAARFCMIIGEAELKEGVVVLKDMQAGEQERLSVVDLVNKFKS